MRGIEQLHLFHQSRKVSSSSVRTPREKCICETFMNGRASQGRSLRTELYSRPFRGQLQAACFPAYAAVMRRDQNTGRSVPVVVILILLCCPGPPGRLPLVLFGDL